MGTGMTRRAFVTHPLRSIWADTDRVGLWLRRAGVGKAAAMNGGNEAKDVNGQDSAVAGRSLGLRDAIAALRRN
jgi:hypothetical protein